MLTLPNLFISPAFAQDAAATAPSSPNEELMKFLPFILIFAVFYLLVIRPQQKKLDEQSKMIKALQRGDRIVTSGGIHGKITRLEGDDLIMVEIADGVTIKIDKSSVNGLEAKTEPVANTNEKK